MIESIIKKIDRIIDIWTNFLKGQVLYIPTLGPIYTSGNSVKTLLRDVLNNSQTDDFLPYDKDRRWYKHKKEKILLSKILIDDYGLFIPVKNNFKNNVLKIFYYTTLKNTIDNSIIKKTKKIAVELKNDEKIDKCFLYCFEKPKSQKKFLCHNIYLKRITKKEYLTKPPKSIDYYDNLPQEVKQTFNYLEQESKMEGFGFLWKEFIMKDKLLSPVICAVKEGRIIGAIGPLDILKDAWNILWLLPPYFGIKEELRRKGYGEKLWKSAMSLAYQKDAKYTLVQSLSSSPADYFYKKQRLIKMSEVYSILLE